MYKNRFYYLIFFIILLPGCLIANGGSKKDLDYNYKQFNSIIYITAGLVLIAESEDFFEHYKGILGGKKGEFTNYPLGGIGTKFQFWEHYRIGLEAEFCFTQLTDSYIQEAVTVDEKIIRSISQDIKITSIPLFFSFEFVPLNQQFRTYTGIGIGAVFSNITWNELLSSDISEKRHGGEHYNENSIFPAARLYAGLELGFDKDETENFLGSFIIELKYTMMFRKLKLFSGIANQFDELPENINNSFTILPGYLGLYIGLTFNFDRR